MKEECCFKQNYDYILNVCKIPNYINIDIIRSIPL